jgi:hypothetical protein
MMVFLLLSDETHNERRMTLIAHVRLLCHANTMHLIDRILEKFRG